MSSRFVCFSIACAFASLMPPSNVAALSTHPEISANRQLSVSGATPGASLTVTITVQVGAIGPDPIRGFVLTDRVPFGALPTAGTVTIDGTAVPFTRESNPPDLVHPATTVERWVLETPPTWPEAVAVAAGSTIVIQYDLSVPTDTTSGNLDFPGFSWIAMIAALGDPGDHFGYEDTVPTFVVTDNLAPALSSVTASQVPTRVRVTFSEPVDVASATTLNNYGLDGGVSIYRAELSPDGRSVGLTTSPLTNGATYTLSVSGVQDLAGNVIAPASQFLFTYTSSLIAHWRLDESVPGPVVDSAGGNDGVNTGPVIGQAGQIDGAYQFDGVDDLIDISMADLAPPWTASFWVRRENAANGASLVLYSAAGSLKLEQWNNVKKVGYEKIGTGNFSFEYYAPIDTWAHLIFVGTATDVTLYADGIFRGAVSSPMDLSLTSIGRDMNSLKGTLDDVRINNSALSAWDAENLFQTATNAPPSVTVTGPIAGAQFPVGSDVTLTAATQDTDGIVTSVSFHRNGTLIGAATDNGDGTWSLTWTGVPDGGYEITAIATDNDGGTATSVPAGMTVGTALRIEAGGNAAEPDMDGWFVVTREGDTSGADTVGFVLGGATTAQSGFDFTLTPTNTLSFAAGESTGTIQVQVLDDSVFDDGEVVEVQLQPGGGYGLSAAAAAQIIIVDDEMESGLVLWLPLDETSGVTAFDSAGSNDGTLVDMDATTDWVPGRIGGALDFDGTDDKLDVPVPAGLTLGELTVSFWVNAPAVGAQVWTDWWELSTASGQLVGELTGDNGVATPRSPALYNIGGAIPGATALQQAGPNIGHNNWQHLAYTMSATNNEVRLYVDGELVNSGPWSATDIVTGLSIGYAQALGGNYVRSAIDDFRIYNRALSQSEIQALMDIRPPEVTILSPASGSIFPSSVDIQIQAEAFDEDGTVVQVDFFADNTLLGQDANGQDGWSLIWSAAPIGSHQIYAVAADNDGNETLSLIVQVTVGSVISVQWGQDAAEPGTAGAFTVTRTGDASTPLTVGFTLNAASTAALGDDFTFAPTAEVVFAADEDSKTITVGVMDDVLAEGNESVWIDLQPGSAYALGRSSASLMISDDDIDPSLLVHWMLDEAGGATAVDAVGSNDGALINMDPATDWLPAGGQIDGALDFDGVDDYVYANPADWTATAYTVSVWVKAGIVGQSNFSSVFANDDTGNDFQIDVNGGNPGQYRLTGTVASGMTFGAVTTNWVHLVLTWDGATLRAYYDGALANSAAAGSGNAGEAFGTYELGRNRAENNFFNGRIDDFRLYDRALSAADIAGLYAGTIHFSHSTTDVFEGDGNAMVTIVRQGGNAGAVSVNLATADGTATSVASADYAAITTTLNWADGDSSDLTVFIPITDDAVPESSESFLVSLSGTSGGAVLGTASTQTVTILDDDTGPGVIQFSSASASVPEDGVSVSLTIERVGGSAGAVTVDYATVDGSAVAPTDYTAASGTLFWPDSDMSTRTIAILISDDSTYDPDEVYFVQLSNPTGGASIGGSGQVAVTITDDDPCGAVNPGDLNQDLVVNIIDLNLVLSHFGQTTGDAAWDPMADANCDGVVNIVDLNEVLANFGQVY